LVMPSGKLIYNGQAKSEDTELSYEMFLKIARRYLYSPELQGGKSPFGIDNSAYVQMVYRYLNIYLPRTAELQSQTGSQVDFIELAQKGDLVFCSNEDHIINHVGIYLGEKTIIHVYGAVRIDKLDHHGIFNVDTHKYTHKLRIIKRLLSDNHFQVPLPNDQLT
jgi:gamma-D-glutamyl-L-lysine dipeptidyl-peptidase